MFRLSEKAYKPLVMPTLVLACTTWDPYLKEDKNRIEMVQRRAARCAVNRYHNTSSVTSMLEELKLYTTLKIISRKFLGASLIWTFFSHVGAIFFLNTSPKEC
jgi:hypothetical protein